MFPGKNIIIPRKFNKKKTRCFCVYDHTQKPQVFSNSTVRSKIKKIEIAMINTLQLAARKNLIQMSLQW
jgi:hypothetical protein